MDFSNSVSEVLAELEGLGTPRAKERSSEDDSPKERRDGPQWGWSRDVTLGVLRNISTQLEVMAKASAAIKVEIDKLCEAWGGGESDPASDVSRSSVTDEVSTATEDVIATPPGGAPIGDMGSEAYQRARAAALAKIRGEDIQDKRRREAAEDEEAPFVGSATSLITSKGAEETTIGTLGTFKDPTV